MNMPTLFIKDDPTEAEKKMLQDLEEKGYMQPSLDLGSPIRVTKAMMGDLAENDLFAIFDPKIYGSHAFLNVHGAQDDVIDPEAAKRFAEQFDIPITFFAGEGHSISNDPQSPERLAVLAIEWFLS